jgi:NAD+ dependent glucose-6-phosphate dehydrogenase
MEVFVSGALRTSSMAADATLVITGARGNLGGKLATALSPKYPLRCLDLLGGRDCIAADLGTFDDSWTRHFEGAQTVLHFAGEPRPTAPWALVQHANIVATANVLRASRMHAIRRVIFASTNQVMAGYRYSDEIVTTNMPPAPLNPYAVSKLFCEEAGRAFAAETGISFIAFRIGNIQPGENIPRPSMGIGLWGQQMWLSNRDFLDGVRAAIVARDLPFAILNLVSNNPGMRWDLAETQRVLGFRPKDGFASELSPEDVAEERMARLARLVPGQWLDQRFQPMRG